MESSGLSFSALGGTKNGTELYWTGPGCPRTLEWACHFHCCRFLKRGQELHDKGRPWPRYATDNLSIWRLSGNFSSRGYRKIVLRRNRRLEKHIATVSIYNIDISNM